MLLLRTMLLAGAVSAALCSSALATPPFYKEFEGRNGNAAPGYGGLIKDAKCNICHVKGEKKDIRNEYGQALKNAGMKKDFGKTVPLPPANVKAIKDAFDKADKEKSSKGDTYGDRIKAGKLPAP